MRDALLFSLFPASGAFLGALLGIYMRLSKQTLAFALHFGAGVVLGVVGVELMPRALQTDFPLVVLLAFVGGSATYVLLGWLAEVIGRKVVQGARTAVFTLTFGVAIDCVTDGMMIAAALAVGNNLGLLLGIGLFVADFPETFSTLAAIRDSVSRRIAILIAVGFGLMVLAGAPIGYLLLTGQPRVVEFGMLAFTSGVLVLVVVEGMVPEAHERTRRQAGTSAMLFSLGFAFFAALSFYLE